MLEQAQAKKIQAGLALVETDELGRIVVKNLPTELGTNGARGARNQYPAVGKLVANRFEVDLHALAAEQVIEADVAQLADCYLPGDDVLERGHGAEADARTIAGFNKRAHLRAG